MFFVYFDRFGHLDVLNGHLECVDLLIEQLLEHLLVLVESLLGLLFRFRVFGLQLDVLEYFFDCDCLWLYLLGNGGDLLFWGV